MKMWRRRPLNRRARLLLATGMLCLAVGLGLRTFLPHDAETGSPKLETAANFLVGLSLSLNLGSVFANKRDCRTSAS